MSKKNSKIQIFKIQISKGGSYEKYLASVVFDVDYESAIRFSPKFFKIFESRNFSYQMTAKIKSLFAATFKLPQNHSKKLFSYIKLSKF